MTKKEIFAVLEAQMLSAWIGYFRNARSKQRHLANGDKQKAKNVQEEQDRNYYNTINIWNTMEAFGFKHKQISEAYDRTHKQAIEIDKQAREAREA